MAPFEGLTQRLQDVFRRLRGKTKIVEQDLAETLREVRIALLEADVNVSVVKDLIDRIRSKALGIQIEKEFNPEMAIVQIVNEELTELLGGEATPLVVPQNDLSVYMMVGLQGAGKTTTTAKLARWLASQQRKPLLVACDPYRPAAITQLQVLGEQIQVPVFAQDSAVSPVVVAREALEYARANGHDTVLIDTAGRLHIDESLMSELEHIRDTVRPHDVLLTIDAMTGQDAVEVAKQFHEKLAITGVIVTKLDGDTRGGAALSVKSVTGQPIKFVTTGEKLDAIEPFYPDRMASRILGMGDLLTLIEKAQATMDERKAQELERKMREARFTLNDFLEQMQQLKKMGPLEGLLDLIPGVRNNPQLKNARLEPSHFKKVEAIIYSMTAFERENPDVINGKRRARIARGSGTAVAEVNRLIAQFDDMRKLMKKMANHEKERENSKKDKKGKKIAQVPTVKKSTMKKSRFPF